MAITDVPDQRVDYRKVPSLTIGNRMRYRDIALDLVSGRLEEGQRGTAPQDWYITYYGGGGLDKALQFATEGKLTLPGD